MAVAAFDLGVVAPAGDPTRHRLVVLPGHVREPERRLEGHGIADPYAALGVGGVVDEVDDQALLLPGATASALSRSSCWSAASTGWHTSMAEKPAAAV